MCTPRLEAVDGTEPLFLGFILGPPVAWGIVLAAAWFWRGIRPQGRWLVAWLTFSAFWLGIFLALPILAF